MKPTHGERWVAYAMLYRERYGLSVLAMGDDKTPSIPWKEFQTRLPAVSEIMSWPKQNLAIITGKVSNLVVIDCDTEADARWFWNNKGQTNSIVKTRRGYHFYFRCPEGEPIRNATHVEWDGVSRYDVRGEGGYVLCPPSRHSEGEYTWAEPLIPPSSLPPFNPEWRPERPEEEYESDKRITDGIAYIAQINAVSGSGGHDDTYRAVACLHDSGMSESEALLAILSWNRTNADPPWSERDLLHKIRDVYK
jgi:hypothetical protein